MTAIQKSSKLHWVRFYRESSVIWLFISLVPSHLIINKCDLLKVHNTYVYRDLCMCIELCKCWSFVLARGKSRCIIRDPSQGNSKLGAWGGCLFYALCFMQCSWSKTTFSDPDWILPCQVTTDPEFYRTSQVVSDLDPSRSFFDTVMDPCSASNNFWNSSLNLYQFIS